MKKAEAEKLLKLLNIEELEYLKNTLGRLQNKPISLDFKFAAVIQDCFEKQLSIKEYLLSELMYEEQRKNKQLTIQKMFEKYITTVIYPGYNKENIYGNVDGLFTFTNFISLYQLSTPLVISDFITNKQKRGSRWEYRSRIANEDELNEYLFKFQRIIDNSKLLVESDRIFIEQEKVIVSYGAIRHFFSMKQMDFMNKFLGNNIRIYISEKTPIVYGESDKGKGFIFGFKKLK